MRQLDTLSLLTVIGTTNFTFAILELDGLDVSLIYRVRPNSAIRRMLEQSKIIRKENELWSQTGR